MNGPPDHIEGYATAPAFFGAALDHLSDGVIACDAGGHITLVNRRWRETFGLPDGAMIADVLGAYRVTTVAGEPLTIEKSALYRALRGEVVHGFEVVATDLAGFAHHLVADAQPIFQGQVQLGAVMTLHDVTAEREAETQAERQRLHDPLTGLPNRSQFLLHLAQQLEAPDSSLAVLHLDVDRFRQVNDHLGQDGGDHVLCEIAIRLTAAAGDDIVARVGGDEFAVIARGVQDQQDAMLLASRLRDAIAAPVMVAGEPLRLSTGLGIALSVDGARVAVPENLLRDAEAATRRAKQQGPSNYGFFSSAMRVDALERIANQGALDKALELQQFRLVYQPKLSLDTQRITGAEALLRWERDGDTVAPAHFIPLAEESGAIVPIGAWVLQEAAAQAARWAHGASNDVPMHVAANVSPRQFRASLIPSVRRVLGETGVAPELLCIELTEGAVMADVDETISILRGLKDLGVRISVDDFGTGYSSLAYLKRFPLDELKVDRSFVDGLGDDPEDTAIVGAVIAMAHALQLEVVAEGVETTEQLDRLRSLGCDHVQGYLIARPTTTEAIDVLRQAESPARGAAARVGHGRRVLVVDDTAVVRQLARVSLTTSGFEVREAATAREAIELALELRPDCVVLDVNLPDALGYDVCMQLRADPTTAGTTIVMLTAEADAEAKIAAFSAGADDYMIKPFSPRDLVGRVTAAIRRRSDGVV